LTPCAQFVAKRWLNEPLEKVRTPVIPSGDVPNSLIAVVLFRINSLVVSS